MPLHYILDGYNILWALPYLLKKSSVHFEPSREGFIHFLIQVHPHGGPKNRVRVVFDGYAEMKVDWARLREANIEVLFSEGQSADDQIVELVKQSQNPKGVTVVTSDRELSDNVRKLDAQVISITKFIEKVGAKKKTSKPHTEKKETLPPEDARRITEELKRIWLK